MWHIRVTYNNIRSIFSSCFSRFAKSCCVSSLVLHLSCCENVDPLSDLCILITTKINVALYQGLHCLLSHIRSFEKELDYFLETVTWKPSIYKLGHSDFILCRFIEHCIDMKRVLRFTLASFSSEYILPYNNNLCPEPLLLFDSFQIELMNRVTTFFYAHYSWIFVTGKNYR